MSLYRQPGAARARLAGIVAVVALAVGIALGYALGSAGEDPSARAVVDGLRSDLRPVSNGLSLLPNEYEQAYRGSGNESAAVSGALDRVRNGLRDARGDLRVLDPEGARELEAAVAALEQAVGARRPPARVAALADEAADALRAVSGGD